MLPARRPDLADPPADVTELPAGRIAALIAAGDLDAEAVALAHLRRIAERNPVLNAVVSVDAERALAAAREIDRRRRARAVLGALAGVPFVVKDNVDVRAEPTMSGSRVRPAPVPRHDAPAVTQLLAADAVLLGRANMDELAMGGSTQSSAYGPTRNPHDARRSPGGSSGGSAAAVAAGLATLAIGTDTGGSVREPAAQCGLVGMAPSPGLVPLDGVVPFAPALDRLGPLARTVDDIARMLAVLAGRPLLARAGSRDRTLRAAVVVEVSEAAQQAGVRRLVAGTIDALAGCDVDVLTVSVPEAPRALTAYLHVTAAAAFALTRSHVGTGRAGAEVTRRHEIGRRLLGPDAHLLRRARAVQRRLRAQVADALRHCDVLLMPTMPCTAPLLADAAADLADPLAAPYTDCWTVIANLADLPSISVPIGRSPDDGMPVGLMITGRAGSDALLLDVARRVETRSSPDGATGNK